MIKKFEKIKNVKGELNLSGDKSISHRAVMFGAIADGVSVIRNCSKAEDVSSTMSCFGKMGVKFEHKQDHIVIHGKGFKGLEKPSEPLFAGNSGTTTRLIAGILCAQNFESTITGDDSLSKRPMMRIVDPLKLMGARMTASGSGTLPLVISPSEALSSVEYKLKVASAQVKSAMLLAGMHLENESVIIEPVQTRNHTEKMLGLKCELTEEGNKIIVSKNNYPKPFEMFIPSDISSAAFFMVLASLIKNSDILIKNVTLNESRAGIVTVLKLMGGKVSVENEIEEGGEKRGDIHVSSSQLKNIEIPAHLIPNIIDEIPILSVAGVFAENNFIVRGAKELRVKESDRIKALCHNFNLLGLDVNEFEDGFELSGEIENKNITFESFGDHRIAMAFAIMSSIMESGGSVGGFEAVGISNPNFVEQLNNLAGQ